MSYAMKTDHPANKIPLALDTLAARLGCDRRTLSRALETSARLDFIEPADREGVRGSRRWTLADACEALQLHQIRMAPPDNRPWSEAIAREDAEALARPCPRCGGFHVEAPLLPLPTDD